MIRVITHILPTTQLVHIIAALEQHTQLLLLAVATHHHTHRHTQVIMIRILQRLLVHICDYYFFKHLTIV